MVDLMAGWWLLAAIIGAALLINVFWRLIERFAGIHRVPKEHEAWVAEVKRVLIALVDVDIDRHNIQMRLAHLVGKQPPEYDALARDAFARQMLLNPALAAKAEEVGLFAPGTFERAGVPAYENFDPTKDVSAPPQLRVVRSATPIEPDEPSLAFVGTVQVPSDRRSSDATN